MLLKKIRIIAVAFAIMLTFSGCQKFTGISEMTIAQGVGIDRINGDTVLSVEYLDLSEGTGTTDTLGEDITSLVTVSGDNISYAIAKASSSVSGPIYFGQNRMIVFGEDYCKKDLTKGVDYVLRGVDSRVDVSVAMSENSAKSMLKTSQNKSKVPVQSLYETVMSGAKNSLSINVYANDLLNISSSKTSDLFLPILKEKDKGVLADGIAVFSNEKLVGKLDEKQTMAFIIIRNQCEGGLITVKDEKLGAVGLDIISCKTKNKAKLQNNKLVFETSVNLKLNLSDTEKGIATKVSEDDMNRLEALAKNKIKNICKDTVSYCFEKKSDPFFFDKMVAKSYPKYYKAHQNNWRDELKDVDYEIEVKAILKSINNSSIKG